MTLDHVRGLTVFRGKAPVICLAQPNGLGYRADHP